MSFIISERWCKLSSFLSERFPGDKHDRFLSFHAKSISLIEKSLIKGRSRLGKRQTVRRSVGWVLCQRALYRRSRSRIASASFRRYLILSCRAHLHSLLLSFFLHPFTRLREALVASQMYAGRTRPSLRSVFLVPHIQRPRREMSDYVSDGRLTNENTAIRIVRGHRPKFL